MKTEAPVPVLIDLECGHGLTATINYVTKTEYCPECRCMKQIAGVKTMDQLLRYYEGQV